ncbi:NADH dehydrogenase [Cyclobacterium qasimii M12-11B]|uniref:NADH dehydrogenase n=1 Tax=Cyclobacterium qasimii M12-11B TaxID=641524 RepID=S7WH86_9BACT|nr:NADH dehydrogenase [Cyclobacterium qasimii M12-11B]
MLWAAGIKPNGIEGLQEIQMFRNGRLLVDEHNLVNESKNIYALGDLCLQQLPDYPKGHPQVAQVAIQQADNLANNFLAKLKNKPSKAFKYKNLGSMATVGRKLAVVDLPFIKLQGLLAWLIWLFVHLMAILGVKNRIFIFLDWSWNYLAFDPSLRLLIRPTYVKPKDREELIEDKN